MKSKMTSNSILAPLVLVAGVVLLFVPADVVKPFRSVVRDALRPAQLVVRSGLDSARHWMRRSPTGAIDSQPSDKIEEELKLLRLTVRKSELEAARLREKLAAAQKFSASSTGGLPSLANPQLIEARVLGEESSRLWRNKQFLSVGSAAGVVESAIVLESTRPLVDQGKDAQITPGDAVYAGRVVIGKIAEVGRYSSTLRLVTDPGYSGRARLARRTSRGSIVFGAEGTITADGSDLCRLIHITEPAHVGDEVYTGGADGLLPSPMYYGRVVRAELEPGAREWSIWVKPALLETELRNVLVLRHALNPDRILAN